MNEKALIRQWNQLRSHIIQAQIAPTLVLIAVFVSASFDLFLDATDTTKYLVIGVIAASGILATVNQFAAVREADAILKDLKKISDPSALAKRISRSGQMLSASAALIVVLDLAIFGLVIWAVLG